MDTFDELLWTIKSKGFKVYNEDKDNRYLKLLIPFKFKDGFKYIIEKLNNIYGKVFDFNYDIQNQSQERQKEFVFEIKITDSTENLEEEIQDLNKAILLDEYINYEKCDNGKIFDIKLGMSCNNNCIHCVIKPNIFAIQSRYPNSVVIDSGVGMQCNKDLTFKEITNIILQNEDISTIVLTGGEPTIRKDFLTILKWIYYNKPGKNVYLQTNGRNLSDLNLVKSMVRYTKNLDIAIAVHGTENIHNKIVNNRKDNGNPFIETMQGIKNIMKFLVKSSKHIRTETVLTSHNIDDIVNMIEYLYNLGIRKFGISYPHLDGFSDEDIVNLVPSLKKTISLLARLNEYVIDNDDCSIGFEEIPPCIFNELGTEIKLQSFGWRKKQKKDVNVNYVGKSISDFENSWTHEHTKFKECDECLLNDECIGVWCESAYVFNSYIHPITKVESNLIGFLESKF